MRFRILRREKGAAGGSGTGAGRRGGHFQKNDLKQLILK